MEVHLPKITHLSAHPYHVLFLYLSQGLNFEARQKTLPWGIIIRVSFMLWQNRKRRKRSLAPVLIQVSGTPHPGGFTVRSFWTGQWPVAGSKCRSIALKNKCFAVLQERCQGNFIQECPGLISCSEKCWKPALVRISFSALHKKFRDQRDPQCCCTKWSLIPFWLEPSSR